MHGTKAAGQQIDSPLGSDIPTGVYGVEKVRSLLLLLDISIDEEGIRLRMYVLHHDLETVEAAGLWYLNLATESLDKVLVDNAIGCSEEGKDMRDEVAFVIVKSVVPVVKIFGEINLLCRPEGCFGLLVHLPNLL